MVSFTCRTFSWNLHNSLIYEAATDYYSKELFAVPTSTVVVGGGPLIPLSNPFLGGPIQMETIINLVDEFS